jgi:hypothetical protein
VASGASGKTPLQAFLDGRWDQVRDEARALLRDPLLRPVEGLPLDDHRERVIAEVNALCVELRADAAALVDAFGVPDEAVAAPIALGAERERQEARRGARSAGG